MKTKLALGIWFFSWLPFLTGLQALSTPPEFPELVRDSDYIVKVHLHKIKEKKINKKTISVTCKAKVLDAYKTSAVLASELDLAFLVFPELIGKWFKQTPDEGTYILFLINKPVKDAKGTVSNVISLYEPHPYAIYTYSEELEAKIRKTIQ